MRALIIACVLILSISISQAQAPDALPAEQVGVAPQELIVSVDTSSYKSREEYVLSLSLKYGQEYNVSPETIMKLIRCENRDLVFNQQSLLHYSRDHKEWGVSAGDQEQSYGLAQIHLPSHPEISYNEAIDPVYAVEFIASQLAKGRGSQWSCYNLI